MSGHVQGRLSAYRDGELSVVEAAEVRQHVESCEACADRLRVLEDVDLAVRGAFVPAGPREGFSARVRAGIEAGSARGAPRSVRLWPWMGAAAAAVLIAVVGPRLLSMRAIPEAVAPAAPATATAASPAPAPPPTSLALSATADERLRALGYVANAPAPPSAPPPQEASSRGDASSRLGVRDAKPDTRAKSEDAPPPPAASGPQRGVRSRAPELPKGGGFATAPPPPPPAPAQAAAPEAVPVPRAEARRERAEVQQEAATADEAVTMTAPAEAPAQTSRDAPTAGAAAPAAEGFADTHAGGNRQERERKPQAKPGSFAETKKVSEHEALARRQPRSLGEARELRERWRRQVESDPQSPRADEARVQVVAMGVAAVRQGGGDEDRARARADAAAYLAREDAAQKDRVRTMLAEIRPD